MTDDKQKDDDRITQQDVDDLKETMEQIRHNFRILEVLDHDPKS